MHLPVDLFSGPMIPISRPYPEKSYGMSGPFAPLTLLVSNNPTLSGFSIQPLSKCSEGDSVA